MKIRANNIDIEVEDTGPGLNAQGVERPAVMLIMGLGMQLIAWPLDLVNALVDAGYRVIRFDNRDIGLSQHFDEYGVPNIMWAALKVRLGLSINSPYSLGDMAADAVGVLDALNVAQAHIVGVSMGGMIAQRVALAAPHRCLSLTSIMSTSGARGLPQAKPAVVRALIDRPSSHAPQDIGDFYVRLIKVIGSPAFPVQEAEVRARAAIAFNRSYHPQGVARQMVAIAADTSRAKALATLQVPTLVVHGVADVLVPLEGGRDTAKRVPDAKLVEIDGMGHDLPPGVVTRILAVLLPHVQASALRTTRASAVAA
jgi:pimeloyl-ACP methyl ester carboxylesterase